MQVPGTRTEAMLSRLLRAETTGGARAGEKDYPKAKARSVRKINQSKKKSLVFH